MKLWHLKPIDPHSGPWKPWYDKAFGFVIRAEDEETARYAAESCGGDEIRHGNVWQDNTLTSCVELLPEGEQEVVIGDYHAA
jgi:hypothetical protein